MLKIGITCRLERNEFEIRNTLDVSWARLFRKLNFIPVVILNGCPISEIHRQIGLNGLLLTGGNDLCSQNFSELSKDRDLFEITCLEFALKNRLPILGVCRGMQLVAQHFSSSLRKSKRGHVGTEHKIEVSKDSIYASILSTISSVNSYHNFSINRLNENFTIAVHSTDGEIEAFESNAMKIFAQMWHPERTSDAFENSAAFVGHFFTINQ